VKAQKMAAVANVRLLASPLARLAVVLQISHARTQDSNAFLHVSKTPPVWRRFLL
jgi:hypothetical protein